MNVAKILKVDDGFGHYSIKNIEVWPEVPADTSVNGRPFTYRQLNKLNPTDAGSYYWPVGNNGSVILNDDPVLCQYFDLDGNALSLTFEAN